MVIAHQMDPPVVHAGGGERQSRRALTAAVIVAVTLVALRSLTFVISPDAWFDSDQAIFGLMAKHIAEGRAFPVYGYGQRYLLGIEAWLAAPLFWAFGARVVLLKLPVLLMNAAVGAALVLLLVRDAKLRPIAALLASSPFLLTGVWAGRMLGANHGCSVEPLLATILIWVLRKRTIAVALVAAVFYLNRELTLFALSSLALLELLTGELRSRRHLGRRAISLVLFAGVVMMGRWVATFGPNYVGAATPSLSFVSKPGRSLAWVFAELVPYVLGYRPGPFSVSVYESAAIFVPLAVAGLVLAATVIVGLATRGNDLRRHVAPGSPALFPLYLLVTGLQPALALSLFSGMQRDVWSTRFLLLMLLAVVGAVALFFHLQPRRALLRVAAVALIVLAAINGVVWTATTIRNATATEPPALTELTSYLESHGVTIGAAPYWVAYTVAFLSHERVRLTASSGWVKLGDYEREFRENHDKAVVISEAPCANQAGEHIRDWYVCPPIVRALAPATSAPVPPASPLLPPFGPLPSSP